MAHYLTGSDWNSTGSYDDADVPDAGEDVILGADSPALTTGPSGANQDVKIGTLHVLKDYKYDFCSSGAPWIGSAAKIIFEHPGNAYVQADAGGAANKTNKVIIRAPGFNSSQVIQLGKAADPGDIEYVVVARGNVQLVNPTGLLKVLVDHVSNPSGDAQLTIDSASGTIPFLEAKNGRVINSTTITTAIIDGAAYLRQALNTITNLHGGGQASIDWDAAATCAIAWLGGLATLDLTKTDKAKVFTTTYLLGRSILKRWPGSALHTFTNAIDDWRDAA